MDQDLHIRRKYLLSQARFYGILDTGYVQGKDLERAASEMIDNGVEIIQLRAKNETELEVFALADRIRMLFFGVNVLFIINDYPQVAVDVGADGVHVGQDDLMVSEVLEIIDPEQLVGISTHSLEQAKAAVFEKPDYIALGPIFTTPTKPSYPPVGLPLIRQVSSQVSLPIFCIGGINLENLSEVLSAGAGRIVMVSGILQSSDVATYCTQVKNLLGPKGLFA